MNYEKEGVSLVDGFFFDPALLVFLPSIHSTLSRYKYEANGSRLYLQGKTGVEEVVGSSCSFHRPETRARAMTGWLAN